MDADAIDCGRSDTTLQLVPQGDSTSTGPDGDRPGGQYPVLTNDVFTPCFILNLSKGSYYAIPRAAVPVDCTDPTAYVEVAVRVEGGTEDAACAADCEALAYRDQQRVFCLNSPWQASVLAASYQVSPFRLTFTGSSAG